MRSIACGVLKDKIHQKVTLKLQGYRPSLCGNFRQGNRNYYLKCKALLGVSHLASIAEYVCIILSMHWHCMIRTALQLMFAEPQTSTLSFPSCI